MSRNGLHLITVLKYPRNFLTHCNPFRKLDSDSNRFQSFRLGTLVDVLLLLTVNNLCLKHFTPILYSAASSNKVLQIALYYLQAAFYVGMRSHLSEMCSANRAQLIKYYVSNIVEIYLNSCSKASMCTLKLWCMKTKSSVSFAYGVLHVRPFCQNVSRDTKSMRKMSHVMIIFWNMQQVLSE